MTNFFQSRSCFDFLSELGFLTPFFISSEFGKIVGYLQKDGGTLKRFLSRRAIVNGGPELSDDATDAEIYALLTKCRKTLCGKAIYIEFRNFADYGKYRPVFEKAGFKYVPHYNFVVDTSSTEVVEANLGKSRKRDVRTSLRDGAVIDENPTLEDVRELYLVLDDLYRTKVKTPLFPLSFFEKLYEAPFGRFIVVRYEGKVVGGTVLACGDDTVYEWFACGRDGISKSVFPSTLATYGGIMFAAKNGYTKFDMMGAGAPGDGGYGVRDFKAKFGGELVEYGRFLCVLNRPLYELGKLGVKILK